MFEGYSNFKTAAAAKAALQMFQADRRFVGFGSGLGHSGEFRGAEEFPKVFSLRFLVQSFPYSFS